MRDTETDPRFYAALGQSSSEGPINLSAMLQDHNLVLGKAASLLGYREYLSQARSWKAARRSAPLAFEREVQVQATQALADTRDLATAALHITRHLRVAGGLDRMLDSWIAGVRTSGPVQAQHLWSDVVNDPAARDLLRAEGLSNDLFSSVDESMKGLNSRIGVQDGELSAELEVGGHARHVALTHSARPPRTLEDLLTRGQFERMVERFGEVGALSLDVVAREHGGSEAAELVLGGAILSVQSVAQHKRKLEDTGLATYAGQDPLSIAFVAGLLAIAIGGYLKAKYCTGDDDGVACKIGEVLFILGLVTLIVGVGYFGVNFALSLNSLNVLNLGLQ